MTGAGSSNGPKTGDTLNVTNPLAEHTSQRPRNSGIQEGAGIHNTVTGAGSEAEAGLDRGSHSSNLATEPGRHVGYNLDGSHGTGAANTSGHGTANTSGYGTANTSGHGVANTSGYGTADTPGYGTANTSGHGTTNTSGHGTANTSGHGTADTPGYGTANTSGLGATDSSGYAAANTSGHGNADTSGYGTANTSGYGATDTSGYDATHSSGHGGRHASSSVNQADPRASSAQTAGLSSNTTPSVGKATTGSVDSGTLTGTATDFPGPAPKTAGPHKVSSLAESTSSP